ncbi:hypothetical protein C8R47DRAFT_1147538, partial [Mycena vitilis]
MGSTLRFETERTSGDEASKGMLVTGSQDFRRCDPDEDDCPNNGHTRSQSSATSKATNSTLTGVGEVHTDSRTHAAVVALACVLSLILATIVVFFFWRRSVRKRQHGPRPYLEISDAESIRPISSRLETQTTGGVSTIPTVPVDPVHLLPPIQPFLRTERRSGLSINFRSFTDLQRVEQGKRLLVAEGAPSGGEQCDPGFEVPPPGYRSTETLVL